MAAMFARATVKTTLQAVRPAAAQRTFALGRTEYAGRRTVTLIPGDGVGPELMNSVKTVFAAVGAPVDFEEIQLVGGDPNVNKNLKEAIVSLQRNGVGLKGVVNTPVGRGTTASVNVQLRGQLDLFANVVEIKSLPNVKARHNNVNIVVVRQNTEAEYSFMEHEVTPGVVESLKVITRDRSMEIAKFAFDYAVQHGRKKVTAVHKANIMKQGDGLFLESCKQVAALYPNIAFEGMIVDNTSMQMVGRPQQFDVLVTPNLYGNIVSNIGAGLIGGAGVIPGFNMSAKVALYEPGARASHGDQTGKNVVNPTAVLMASVNMLRHLGFKHHAQSVSAALQSVYANSNVRTADLGGNSSTTAFTAAVVKNLVDPAILAGASA